MTRRTTLAVAVMLAVALPAAANPSLGEAWIRVQQELASPSPEGLEEKIEELRQAAQEVEARRLTPYAAALARWANDHPGANGEVVLRLAASLDPALPSPDFIRSRWSWNDGSYFRAVASYVVGWVSLFTHHETRRLVLASTGAWLLLALVAAFIVAVLVMTANSLREMAHDAVELGQLMFKRANAVAFATVLLLLPLFAALGPVWLVAYLFALSWAYMARGQLVAAISACCILSLLIPTLDAWQQATLHRPHLISRVIAMLEQRRIDPSTLRELAELEPQVDDIGIYHLVLGELLRMHGDADEAHLQFQKAALADSRDARTFVFLGNVAMENGDVPRGVQQYNAALEIDPNSALAYYNLSYGYDQTYRFQQGDNARTRARELSGQRLDTIGVGGSIDRIRYPRLGREDVGRVVAKAPAELHLVPTYDASVLGSLGLLLAPSSVAFWACSLLGVIVLVIRSRWMWKASTCTRCGKVFCSKCKTSTESATYCSQCISVFLKRDGVSIEQQTAKIEQIRRWELLSSVTRKVTGMLVPGSISIIDGHVWQGVVFGFLMWLLLLGALVWLPQFLPSIEPALAILPIQVILLAGFAALWLRSLVAALYRR